MKHPDNKCAFVLKMNIPCVIVKLKNPKAYKSKDREINMTVPLLPEE